MSAKFIILLFLVNTENQEKKKKLDSPVCIFTSSPLILALGYGTMALLIIPKNSLPIKNAEPLIKLCNLKEKGACT